MVEAGLAMAKARTETVARLNRALAERVGAFPAAQLSLDNDDIDDTLSERLARARIRDAEAGRTTVGPHLVDLTVRHTQKRTDARECSTGEQKALLISIVLADARELSRARNGLVLSCCWTRSRHISTSRGVRRCSKKSWSSAHRPG